MVFRPASLQVLAGAQTLAPELGIAASNAFAGRSGLQVAAVSLKLLPDSALNAESMSWPPDYASRIWEFFSVMTGASWSMSGYDFACPDSFF